ncbi:unnamed protein product [Didymodactylos carnosus]|uniref:Ammonium transporter AmtB-like domain-containing protein n=1 Tax=Didymodactylos carnosus TaxID=1234261 RepID=A0A8S2ELU9_9BILA|nr:unnamed protein product [Didymodactylos carnosus]CAF3992653.1 unnamed protein product [Didymodactylos carnosus]
MAMVNSSNTTLPLVIKYDTGDNAWMMTSTALVFMMTPALAFFYGGMVDKKNVLNQLFLSIICMGIVIFQWVLVGFSFAFGPPVSKGFGSFGWAALRFGELYNPNYSPTYPLLTYCAYQLIHISSGVSGFVASAILGRRIDQGTKDIGNNLPFSILGASLLWVGWNGFNAGSANAASGLAALALINTNAAAASALVTWVLLDAIRGSVTITGACIGPVVGLVAITPAAGYVQPGWALLIGIIGAACVYVAMQFKEYLNVDDTLDVAICHGLGGMVGAFCTGLFTQLDVNPAGGVNAFSAVCTALILIPMNLVWNLFGSYIRVSVEDELAGLDATAHGESWLLGVNSSAEKGKDGVAGILGQLVLPRIENISLEKTSDFTQPQMDQRKPGGEKPPVLVVKL